MKRVHATYIGMVQGVGFRFTIQQLALGLDIKGWVKNLPNGSVEIMAEQKEEVLEEFLNKVGHSFSRYIRDTDISWQDTKGEFKDFQIRF